MYRTPLHTLPAAQYQKPGFFGAVASLIDKPHRFMEHSFSDRLLLHPLFQGFSRLDFLDIVGATPFDFRSFSPKATLVHQGEPCVRLHLLLRGTVEIVRESPNRLYSITEELTAPCTIGAARLYGLHNLHTH